LLKRICFAVFACTFALSFASHAQSSDAMSYKAAATTQFGNHPALPACVTIAVQDGDPGKSNSLILLKFKAGCTIPWHWHTPNERLIMISGSGKAEMKGMPATMMKPGDFLFLASKGIHQFHAVTAVELFDLSDAPFDIHYVNASGTEIPVADALKPTR
jgi:quercetin dioxygenase-like cupin family protein